MRLPTYQPRVSANPGANAVRVDPHALDSGQADGLARASQALVDFAARGAAAEERAAEQAAAIEAAKAAAQARLDWQKALDDAKTAAPPGAPDFSKTFLDHLDEDTKTRLGTMSERARPLLERALPGLRTQFGLEASRIEAASRVAKQEKDLGEIVGMGANAVRTNADALGEAIGNIDAAIGAIPPEHATEEQRSAFRTKAVAQLVQSTIQGLNETDPEAAAAALKAGRLQWPNADGTTGEISIDGTLAPAAKNVLVNDNLKELRRRESERKAAAAEARRAEEHRRAVLRAEVTDRLRDEEAARADGRTTGLTSGEIRDAFADNPRRIAAIEGRLALLDETAAARKALATASPEEEATILGNVAPDVVNSSNTERPVPAGLIEPGNIDLAARPVVDNGDGTISTVRSMSIEEDGKEVLIPMVSDDGRVMTDQEAIDTYRATGRHLGVFEDAAAATAYAKSLHDDQAAAYVSEGYAGRRDAFDLLQAEIDRKRKALAKDPAGYAVAVSPELQAKRTAAFGADAKPGDLSAYLHASLDLQAKMGVPAERRSPLALPDAEFIVERFLAAESPQAKLDILLPVTVGLNDDALARQALDALEAAKLPRAAVYALDVARDPARRNTARRLLAELSTPPAKVVLTDKDANAVKVEARDTYRDDLGAVMAKAYAVTGNPAYEERAQADVAALEQVTRTRTAGGGSDDPAGSAYGDLFGHVATVDVDDLAHVWFDSGRASADDVEAGLVALRGQAVAEYRAVQEKLLAAELDAMGDASAGKRAGYENLRRRQIDDMAAAFERAGTWVNQGDGYALAVPGGHGTLPTAYDLDAVLAAGKTTRPPSRASNRLLDSAAAARGDTP